MSRTSAPQILTVPNVGKVDIIGAQDEVIYLEFSTRQIAALGIDQQAIVATLQAQNAITPSGVIAGGAGAHQRARRRPVHLRREPARHQSAGQRPLLPAERRRHHHAAAMSIRRRRCSASTASRRSGLPIGMKPGANLLEFGEALRRAR